MSMSGALRSAWASIAEVDPEVWAAMRGEADRQRWKIELIASENYTFAAVMEAQGSWLTNKYAEGLPGRRYYGGCEWVDVVERLAQERALALFPGAAHVNVQPHSGAQANQAAFFAVLTPGDRILGLRLDQGGHLTHGLGVNLSGRWFEAHHYGLDPDDGDDRLRRAGAAGPARCPRLLIAGASMYSRILDFERLAAIAHDVGPTCSSTWPTSRGSSPRACTLAVPARRHRDDHHPQDAPRAARRAHLRGDARARRTASTGPCSRASRAAR